VSKNNIAIDQFIQQTKTWKKEYVKLRSIMHKHNLDEELKWYAPCYSYQNGIVLILGGFKDFISIGFFKGALLSDPQKVLVKPGENTESSRILKFKNIDEIIEQEALIDTYINEAIEIEKAGLKITYTPISESDYPEELYEVMREYPHFKSAFEKLSPGRKKGYILFFNAPKQSKTRTSRIEKHIDRILDGKGLNDY